MYRTVIFDCDGVLIMNSNDLYDQALEYAVNKVDPTINSEVLNRIMENTRGKTFNNQLELIFSNNISQLKKSIDSYEEFLLRPDNYSRICLLDGAEKLLLELKKRGVLVCLATGMNPPLLRKLFNDGILPNAFDAIGLVHDIKDPAYQKPHPKILLDILKKVNVSPLDALYVGDTEDDIIMGRLCGIKTIAVLTGRLNWDKAFKIEAEVIVNNALEVLNWIGQTDQ